MNIANPVAEVELIECLFQIQEHNTMIFIFNFRVHFGNISDSQTAKQRMLHFSLGSDSRSYLEYQSFSHSRIHHKMFVASRSMGKEMFSR